MSAVTHLSQFGVSVLQAREFIFANLESPISIFNAAYQYGLTNDMLAEIVGGGVGAGDVRNWFAGQGIDAAVLDQSGSTGGTFLPPELQALTSLVSLNNNADILSSSVLHDRIVASTGASAYDYAFDPSGIPGAEDGILSASDLGIPGMPDLPATQAVLESLYFGTVINMARMVDEQEVVNELVPFIVNNQFALEAGDPVVTEQGMQLLLGIFADPAVQPVLSDAQIADVVVLSGVTFVGIAQWDPTAVPFESLFNNIFTG